MSNKVILTQQGDKEILKVEKDVEMMEKAGMFKFDNTAKELQKAKDMLEETEHKHKKATEGMHGDKLTLEDMIHAKPRKKLISRKIENDIDDYPKSSGASRR